MAVVGPRWWGEMPTARPKKLLVPVEHWTESGDLGASPDLIIN